MNYQSIGSGGGIKQIQNKTGEFGATDRLFTTPKQNAPEDYITGKFG